MPSSAEVQASDMWEVISARVSVAAGAKARSSVAEATAPPTKFAFAHLRFKFWRLLLLCVRSAKLAVAGFMRRSPAPLLCCCHSDASFDRHGTFLRLQFEKFF